MYEVSASVNDISVIRVPLTTDFQIDIAGTKPFLSDKNLKLIFICSPNNPTGNSMNHNDIEYLLNEFNGIVIIDEAYIDFSGKPSFIKLVSKYPNLILMQTFSKAFGLAGVRVGMAFTGHGIIQYFNKLKPPYNISTINQKAVLSKLGKIDKFKREVVRIKKERDRLAGILSKMKHIEKIYPSDANFLLVKVRDANYTYNELIKQNIVIRNRSSVIENCLRITIGKLSENEILIKAMKKLADSY
jgi:histidinol-phosphate aminotransferase